MNWDTIGSYIPYIISGLALFIAFRKQQHEEANIDSKTIQTFADTTASVGKQYKELLSDFHKYKTEANKSIGRLQNQVADLTQKNINQGLELAKERSERIRLEKKVFKLETDNGALRISNKELKETNISQAKMILRLTKWVEQLCNQLKDNKITPVCETIPE